MRARIANDFNPKCTVLVVVSKNDVYLKDYVHLLTKFEVQSTDPYKDTIDFMLTMCSKTEWVRKAIEMRTFDGNDEYVWVDFGIRHVFRCTDEVFVEKLDRLALKQHNTNHVRIGGIWNLRNKYEIDIYKHVAWYFAGGVFGGRGDVLIAFADAMKTKCVDIMTTKNKIMWEVNVWYLLYLDKTVLFDVYPCDHCDSIIDNY
jgi:hypothetical protein